MRSSRAYIASLFLAVILLMQVPFGLFHHCHEGPEQLVAMEWEPASTLGEAEVSCELCDLVFPPVLQQVQEMPDLEQETISPLPGFADAQGFFTSLHLRPLRGPPSC